MEKVKLPQWISHELTQLLNDKPDGLSLNQLMESIVRGISISDNFEAWCDGDDYIFKLADALRYGYEVDEAKEIPDFVKETAKKNAIYIHTKEKVTEVVGRGGALLILDCQYGLKSEDQIKQEKESNDKFNQWMSEDENNHIIYADLIDKYTEEIE